MGALFLHPGTYRQCDADRRRPPLRRARVFAVPRLTRAGRGVRSHTTALLPRVAIKERQKWLSREQPADGLRHGQAIYGRGVDLREDQREHGRRPTAEWWRGRALRYWIKRPDRSSPAQDDENGIGRFSQKLGLHRLRARARGHVPQPPGPEQGPCTCLGNGGQDDGPDERAAREVPQLLDGDRRRGRRGAAPSPELPGMLTADQMVALLQER